MYTPTGSPHPVGVGGPCRGGGTLSGWLINPLIIKKLLLRILYGININLHVKNAKKGMLYAFNYESLCD